MAARSLGSVIRASSLHVSTPTHWLTSRFHFAFADWWDGPQQYGVLRVVNDDIVEARSGFPPHPHRDMEIFSYVVDGELSHKDSMGSEETLGRGAVQYMSAGRGVRHSEMNNGEVPTRFLQIWVRPAERSVEPQYGSVAFAEADRAGKLLHAINGAVNTTPGGHDKTITLGQDVNVYISQLGAAGDESVAFKLDSERQLYLVCIEGALRIDGGADGSVELGERDAFKLRGEHQLQFTSTGDAAADAHFLFLEMAASDD
ncbi:pirin domain-containing protein [Thecamonas trahens ATCC 50062]|uniref:Pirin domain-containing protein n=1 Tax=Thecamonas trahens ATCC 50062 TaxID=461836 RepID=A0A0L0DQI9_THETB|nr:pirin domain-containing protein [Thecamonas trahens ATCC 50062]KNC53688.1 pirin domain-containing protein [Thecamonas trahens ATCC 50062]|eukprot:XP_013762002.1 pirin domain-containing protein [Thecamonas trahens ATCC 50062]